jgi:hypothetical protein
MTSFNPETAYCLALTQKNPTVRFSSKALMNGKDAVGAKWVRPGFSWNEQMDLAWALGFPDMTIVVEGSPELDDHTKWKEYFYRRQSTIHITHKQLMANFYQSITGKDPLELAEKEFNEVVQYSEITRDQVLTLLSQRLEMGSKTMAITQIEALVGPELLADCIVSTLEKTKGEHFYGNTSLLNNLLLLIKRVHKDNEKSLLSRIAAIKFKNEYDCNAQDVLADPLKLGENSPSHMKTPCAFSTQYLDGYPEITMKAVDANRAFGGTRVAYRVVFTGTEAAFDAFVKNHKSIDRVTRNKAYLEILTSIRHERLLPAFLAVADERTYAPDMQLWFQHHKEFFIPGLQKLGKKKGTYQHAANDMLNLLGEQPMAALVPADQQKSLNPPDEWEKSFDELEKLNQQVIALWGDNKAVKKAFKSSFSKICEHARKADWDWHAELFVKCWAEHDLGNLNEEQIQMMRDLYDEIVVG